MDAGILGLERRRLCLQAKAIGVRKSAFTAAYLMALAIPAPATRAAIGAAAIFFYNRTVNNTSNVQINNVYNKTVVVNNTTNVSYNGGTGGTTARATPEQIAAANQQHVPPTAAQTQNMQAAAKDPSLSLNNNQGHPAVAATAHPAEFKGPGVIAAQPGKPVAAISPQGHTVSSPGRTVNTPGAEVGPAAATPGNPPAVTPNNATKDQGNKGGPGTTVVSTRTDPKIRSTWVTLAVANRPPLVQPLNRNSFRPRRLVRRRRRQRGPHPPPPPHAVAPPPPPPPHAAPTPPPPAASAASPRPAGPPPRPAALRPSGKAEVSPRREMLRHGQVQV